MKAHNWEWLSLGSVHCYMVEPRDGLEHASAPLPQRTQSRNQVPCKHMFVLSVSSRSLLLDTFVAHIDTQCHVVRQVFRSTTK